MSLQSGNEKTGPSKRWRVFVVLILCFLTFAYFGWQFATRYRIEAEVINGYKNDNRELLIIGNKELNKGPQVGNTAELISKTLADRLKKRGYSVQLIESDAINGRTFHEKAVSTDFIQQSGSTTLSSQAMARAAQVHAGVLRVSVGDVDLMKITNKVLGETYVIELLNPDSSPAWKATLKYRYAEFEQIFSALIDPVAHWEALTDKAIERMQQQGVLK